MTCAATTCFALIAIFLINNAIGKERLLLCVHHVLSADHAVDFDAFEVEDIDPTLCSHLMYAYYGINDGGYLVSKRPILDHYEGNIQRFNDLKQKNRHLKTLIGIGGWENELSSRYSMVAGDPMRRQAFINSTVEFVKKFQYNGIVLHWCYPALFGGDLIEDKINLPIWLKEIKAEFDKWKLLLIVMAAGAVQNVDLSYDIAEINKHVDYIFLTSYDLYGDWRPHIGVPSGLYKSADVDDPFFNVDYMVQSWIQNGADRHKIILGIRLAGRLFTLVNKKENKPGAKFIRWMDKYKHGRGPDPGIMTYIRICKTIADENWTLKWDSEALVPYAHKNVSWVGYENVPSIKLKLNYLKENGLAGAAAVFVENDDFSGVCGGEKYPLLRTLARSLLATSNQTYHIAFEVIKRNKKSKSKETLFGRRDKFDL